jgi:hypothetical protein
MKKPVIALVTTMLVLAGCNTFLNPYNWFGGNEEVPVNTADGTAANPLIPDSWLSSPDAPQPYVGLPIDTVTALRIDRIPGGAIVNATGVARMQGGYAAFLKPTTEEMTPVDGVLTFRFDIILPPTQQAVGDARSREIVVARRLTDQQLVGVRTIRVEGARNAQVSRR